MKKLNAILLLLVLAIQLFFGSAYASKTEKSEPFDVSEFIMHHILDAHEWHLWGKGHEGTSIYLPVILWDNGLKIFSSKELYHGEMVAVLPETSASAEESKVMHYMKGKGEATQ